jgi:hypothetical protein
MNMSNINVHPSNFQSKYDYEAAVKGAEVAAMLSDAVNGQSEQPLVAGFAHQLACSHRTLQAGAVRVLLKGLVKWASDAEVHGNMDARNEAAVKLILSLRQTVIDTPVPFI